MPNNNRVRNEVNMSELDDAAKIMFDHTVAAMNEMRGKNLDCAAAVQAVVQMSMRTYADFLVMTRRQFARSGAL